MDKLMEKYPTPCLYLALGALLGSFIASAYGYGIFSIAWPFIDRYWQGGDFAPMLLSLTVPLTGLIVGMIALIFREASIWVPILIGAAIGGLLGIFIRADQGTVIWLIFSVAPGIVVVFVLKLLYLSVPAILKRFA